MKKCGNSQSGISAELQVVVSSPTSFVSDEDDFIKSHIFTVRGVQVILSSDLAPLYEVEVKYLHRQVKRNVNRFPSDFVFHLSPEEVNTLRCQIVTSKRGVIGMVYTPLRNKVWRCYRAFLKASELQK